ncbi:hypothetical protein DICA3_A01882 [Diutina catenulata]
MDTDPIQIGFYDPFSTAPTADLEAKFPLTNLHWKYHHQKPVQSIARLPVSLTEEVPKTRPPHHPPTTAVYARIMFVRYDSLDQYRSQVRPLIIEWLKNLVVVDGARPRPTSTSGVPETPPPAPLSPMVSTSSAATSPVAVRESVASREEAQGPDPMKPSESVDTASGLSKSDLDQPSPQTNQTESSAKESEHNQSNQTVSTAPSNHSHQANSSAPLESAPRGVTPWMVVYCASGKEKPSTLVKLSNFDKLTKDFGADGKQLAALGVECERDHVLSYSQGSCGDVVIFLKQLLVQAFTQRYQWLSGQVAASETKLAAQFALARLFSDMQLFSDSLTVYEEIGDELAGTGHLELPEKLSLESYPPFAPWTEHMSAFDTRCQVFASQSRLLRSLAAQAATASLAAIYVSRLYQKLLDFLQGLVQRFRSARVAEFAVRLIDFYIEGEAVSDENVEFRGELRMFERSQYLDIATRVFRYPVMGATGCEISLDDEDQGGGSEDAKGSQEAKDSQGSKGSQESKDSQSQSGDEKSEDSKDEGASANPILRASGLTYPPLLKAMASAQTFYACYEGLTEAAMADFVKCGREKTVDILSIDLALMAYQQGNYGQALRVIQDSYDYFIANGWNFMGGFLLEVYMECLEKTGGDSKAQTMGALKLFQTMLKGIDGGIGINNYGATKPLAYFERLVAKIGDFSASLESPLEFPMSFKLNVGRYVGCEGYNHYLTVEFPNSSPLAFHFSRVVVVLESAQGDQLEFVAEDVHVAPSKTTEVKLASPAFHQGQWWPRRSEVHLNANLRYLRSYQLPQPAQGFSSTLSLTTPAAAVEGDHPVVEVFQRTSGLWCEFCPTTNIELGITEMTLAIHNEGPSVLEGLEIHIHPITPGVTLSIQSTARVDSIAAKSSHKIAIPYIHYSDNKVVEFGARVTYVVDGTEHSHDMSNSVDTTLAVSVTVQDTFRPDCLYSKFSIGSSMGNNPLRLVSTMLETKGDSSESPYTIEPPKHPISDVFVLGDHPVSTFYKITPQANHRVSPAECLDLYISYTSLVEECRVAVARAVEAELKHPEYLYLITRDWLRHLRFEINKYALYGRVSLANKTEVVSTIEDIASDFVDLETARELVAAVKRGIEAVQASTVAKPEGEPLRTYQLHIAVPMPSLNFLHLVRFDYERQPRFLVGEPIQMTVVVNTVTRWASEHASPSQNGPLQLIFQNDDNWSLTGLKRATFMPGPEQFTLEVVMIPLTVGKVAMPRVAVKPVAEAEDTATPVEEPVMDMAVENGNETILVVPELDSITFSF